MCAAVEATIQADSVLDMHTVKMNASACAISAMVTCSVSLISHTHFFTCVLTLSSIVHLSRWAVLSPACDDDEELREQIRLNMGALKKRAAVWSAARIAYTQVTSVTRHLPVQKGTARDSFKQMGWHFGQQLLH